MSHYQPRQWILVPGEWSSESEVRFALQAAGLVESETADGIRLRVVAGSGFERELSWTGTGPIAPELVERLSGADFAVVADVPGTLWSAREELLKLGVALRSAGGIAIRMEGSGLAAGWDTWLDALSRGYVEALYELSVGLVETNGGYVSFGMGQFDRPDAFVGGRTFEDAAWWLDSFNRYQLVESPSIASGDTFRPNSEVQRMTVERWPDALHHPDDGRHNPFGVWRFCSMGDSTVTRSALAVVPIPALSAVLMSAEAQAGRPLGPTDVGTLVQRATCITMSREDAEALTVSRGYVDICPELAWDQWQIVRAWRK